MGANSVAGYEDPGDPPPPPDRGVAFELDFDIWDQWVQGTNLMTDPWEQKFDYQVSSDTISERVFLVEFDEESHIVSAGAGQYGEKDTGRVAEVSTRPV